MEGTPVVSVKNILDFPKPILQRILEELNINDRESFGLTCGEANLKERAIDLYYDRASFVQHYHHSEKGITVSIGNKNKRKVLWKSENDFEEVMEAKHRRIITGITNLHVDVHDLEGFTKMCTFWEGIKIETLFLDIIVFTFERSDEMEEMLTILHQRARSGDFEKIQVSTSGADDQIPKKFFAFLEGLPAIPLTVLIEDETADPVSCDLARTSFAVKALRKHGHLQLLFNCPKINLRKIYQTVAECGRGCYFKIRLNFTTAAYFLTLLYVGIEQTGMAGRRGKLTVGVFEGTPAADAKQYTYFFTPDSLAEFFYFPDTRVLLKLQPYSTDNDVDQYTLVMENVGEHGWKRHWSIVNKSNHCFHKPIRMKMTFLDKLASFF